MARVRHARLVAKLPGQTRQARGLAHRFLIKACGAVVARRRIVVVSRSILTFGALCAYRTRHVAVFAGAARRALGAAFRVGGLAGLAV